MRNRTTLPKMKFVDLVNSAYDAYCAREESISRAAKVAREVNDANSAHDASAAFAAKFAGDARRWKIGKIKKAVEYENAAHDAKAAFTQEFAKELSFSRAARVIKAVRKANVSDPTKASNTAKALSAARRLNAANTKKLNKRWSNYLVFALCMLVTAMLYESLFMPQLVFISFAILVISFIFFSNTQVFSTLFYLLPFAFIFKTGGGTTSFYTLLEVFAIALFFLRRPTVDQDLVILLSALFMVVIVMSFGAIASILRLIIIILLFYCFARSESHESSSRHIGFFILGLLVSSLLGFLKEKIPSLTSMYEDLNHEIIYEEEIARYSGLFDDPNYYSVPMILCIFMLGLSVLAKGKRHRIIMLVELAVFTYLGGTTLSKSFFFMLIPTLIATVLLSNSLWRAGFFVLALIAAALFLYAMDPGDAVNGFAYRLGSQDLTTGRTEIWAAYSDSLFESLGSLLFGHGLGVYIDDMAQHSIFIEGWYQIGMIGLILYAAAIVRIVYATRRRIKRNLGNYFGFGIVITMFTFLNGLTRFEMPFYLMLSTMLYNCDLRRGERPL